MTPLSWSERARTVEITIVSQLEDQECGFTTDENFGGEIPNTIPNQAWPLIFGTVSDNKAVNIQPPVTGTTLDPIGVLGGEELMIASPDDPGLDFLLSYYKAQSQLAFIQTLIDRFNCDPNNSQYTKLRAGYQKQYHDLNIQLEQDHRVGGGAANRATFARQRSTRHACKVTVRTRSRYSGARTFLKAL